MTQSIVELLKDLGNFPKAYYEKNLRRRTGAGTDYLAPEYQDRVRRTVEAIHPKTMRLRVTEIIKETATAKTFRFVRVDGELPPFRPGQYVNWQVKVGGVRTSRAYSISSAPGQDHLDLTIRGMKGGFVSKYLLEKIEIGDSFDTSGPLGGFYHEPLIDGNELVFIAGGSGITPFMSIIRDQVIRDWPLRITLIYGSRKPSDIIFGKELEQLSKDNAAFTYMPVMSEAPPSYRGRRGFITSRLIKQAVADPAAKTFYLCGPNAMYDFVRPELLKLDAPAHKIKRELYGPPADVTKELGWPARLKPTTVFTVKVGDREIPARAGEPLISSLERYGVVVPAECRSGACSACRTKLLSGEVYMPPSTGIRQSDAANGYIHACVAYPLSDLVIRL